MASKTGIANTALRRLGLSQRVTDIDTDTSTEAEQIRAVYDESLESMLKDFNWSFAQEWQLLALLETDPNPEWNFSYRLPTDCINAREIVEAGFNRLLQPTDDDLIPYDIGNDVSGVTGGKVVFTNHEAPYLHYTSRFTEEGYFSGDFASALSWRLAMEVGPALTGDLDTIQRMEPEYNLELDRAKRTDANQLKPKPDQKPGSVRARS